MAYRTEFFGPDDKYRVSTFDDETLVDCVVGLGYRPLTTFTGDDSHQRGCDLVASLLWDEDESRRLAATEGSRAETDGLRRPPNVDHHAWDHTPCKWCGGRGEGHPFGFAR